MSGTEDKHLLTTRVRRLLVGPPRDLSDKSIFHRIALVPLLAWVGLGADGLSSSSYGPEEAFRTLGTHTYLAVGLAGMTILTVFVIASAYSRIIEDFPQGGGGYLVATKLLGPRAGVVSGCALLVDYVMTITVSIAAAGDAIFSFLPPQWAFKVKLPVEAFFILFLITLNIRGVRESVLALAPVFVLFLVTHVILIGGSLVAHVGQIPATAQSVGQGFSGGLSAVGAWGLLLLFIHAYSMGGGTYTGIEAVSNGMPIMREPRVHTGKRTMMYMATSLSLTAGGLLVCYLLWHVEYQHGKTMNAVLAERFIGNMPFHKLFVVLTLFSEGALLVVAAQAGFIDGPRVLANMAVDSWMPRRFSALSDRLTTANGVMLMGFASLAALVYTGGDVRRLVIMYSINVFLTFSLSMFGMSRLWLGTRRGRENWKRRGSLFAFGFVLCATILVITVKEKFAEGGWLTLLITGGAVALCLMIRAHYQEVSRRLATLYARLPEQVERAAKATAGDPDPSLPTAGLLVGGYSGIGIHPLLSIFRCFPECFKGVVFLSVGVVDSGGFKGGGAVEALEKSTRQALEKYVALARGLGIPATCRMSTGTDAVEEAEKLCVQAAKDFSRITFFAGKLIFEHESWYQRFLHNETAFTLQKRLHASGLTLVVIPARLS